MVTAFAFLSYTNGKRFSQDFTVKTCNSCGEKKLQRFLPFLQIFHGIPSILRNFRLQIPLANINNFG
jgi:hypothetical protein